MPTSRSAAEWIARLKLQPHPEGGYYRETYRSPQSLPATVLPAGLDGQRSLATAVLFLLPGEDVSRLHRLRTDEIWCYHAGSSLTLHQFAPTGLYSRLRLGVDATGGACPQVVIPADCWFGAIVDDREAFTLVSCCLAPGFEFADFELAERQALASAWPEHAELIGRLT